MTNIRFASRPGRAVPKAGLPGARAVVDSRKPRAQLVAKGLRPATVRERSCKRFAAAVALAAATTPAGATQLPAGMPKTVIMNRMSVYVPYTAGEQYPALNYDDVRAWLEMTGNTPNAVFGLDSFGLGQWQTSSGPNGYTGAADALGATNFRYALIAEMGVASFSAADLIAAMRGAYADPHYWKVGGKPVLMTYGGQQLGDAWWQNNVLAPLAAEAHPVVFFPMFNGSGQPAEQQAMPANFPHADGYVDWQYANGLPFRTTDWAYGLNTQYSDLDADEASRTAVHNAGKGYLQGILPYYWAACHPARQYYEYWGAAAMYSQWTVAQNGSDAVYLITWNDDSEGTYFVPSRQVPNVPNSPDVISNYTHIGYYEASKWYIKRYLTGVAPALKKDMIWYSYRPQRAVDGVDGNCGAIAANQLYGKVTDSVEVGAFLTAAADVTVTINGIARTAHFAAATSGGFTGLGPFPAGATISVSYSRGGVTLASQAAPSIAASPALKNHGNTSGYLVHDPAKAPGTKDAEGTTWLPSNGGMAGGGAGGWF